ncbi:TonB-dependent receptor [Bryobacter aggregatus]|uniref:TonB-dependent receptor n=1 Tax=Bryobacter aggregatus TaxID=360054 RepID=UPI0004E16703|nr:carboxypeptidase regulatory-like domain-containing protein [Bryobacter aggregatus]
MFRISILLFVLPALAQDNIQFASIGGRVLDPSGATIESAQVQVRNLETNLKREASTGPEGRFRISFLKTGPYELSISRKGFTPLLRQLTLTVGSTIDLDLSLKIESPGAAVQVDSESPLLETTRSQVAGTVTQSEVASLPLNGRNFLDLALLIPGVSPTNTGSNQLFAETSAVPGQGLSVSSQRNFSNNFIVDGLSANDDAAGFSGMFFGLGVVREFQVVTSGGQAEFGRALGGAINMVLKSGTNALHGDLYGYFRNQRLNANNPLSNTKLPSTQTQYGASLGGPLKADRTFYFFNFEQRNLNQSGLITIAPANVAIINQRLAETGYKGSAITTGLYPNPVHNTNFLAKLDHQFSQRNQFSARYSLYDVNSRNSRGAGALNAATSSAGLDNTDQTLAANHIFSLSSRTILETRGQFTRSNLAALPSDPIGPSVSIAGVATFGTLAGSPTGRNNKLTEVASTASHQSGAHSLKAGTDFLYNDLTITYPRSVRGAYTFSSLANFLSGAYNNAGYTQTFGNSIVSQNNPNIGFFAQDEWRIHPRLSLNLGLRYDLQFLQGIATDRNNIAPRAGFAYTPFASRRTVLRGSFGLFYDRVPLRSLANALLSSNNTTNFTATTQASLSLSPTQTGAPTFPNTLSNLPTGVLTNFTTMNPKLQNAYSTQGGLEIEHQFSAKTSLSAGYQFLRGIHLIMAINQNVPTCVAAGNNNGCRPNPNYANNSQYSSLADSNYHGLQVAFSQRPTRWGQYRIAYTYSRSMNNVGENFFSGPIDNSNIWRDYGRSDDDQRHRVVASGALHLLGFELSGLLQYYSSLPFNITSGVTTIQGTAGRPIVNGDFIGRNVGTGNDLFTINTRLSRPIRVTERLRLDAMLEAFNLLNHRNNLVRNGNFGAGAYPSVPSASFNQVTAVNDPRSLQIALRLRF